MNRRFEMSLGQQFADLDRAYRHCCEDKMTLLGRCAELEELVSDYQALMAEIVVHVSVGARRVNRIDALMERAKAALHEGKEEHNA